MVGQGMAWWYRQYAPTDRELARLEADARLTGRGLWAQRGAVAPWDWRKGRGVPVVAVVIGNRRSHVYHAPYCRGVEAMNADNRVECKTTTEAEAKG